MARSSRPFRSKYVKIPHPEIEPLTAEELRRFLKETEKTPLGKKWRRLFEKIHLAGQNFFKKT